MQENPTMTFEEASFNTSKSFLKALQELKSLRPQLYSAAQYCEKSYLRNEEKQMVLENLKDYAVRAIVNTIDHLGTVASKLNDLFEQQSLEISASEVKISCLSQQLFTCQTYTDEEGLRQQQKMTIIPRFHKHYNLPASVNRQVQSSPQKQIDIKGKQIQVKQRPYPSEIPPPQTLSWHLASVDTSPLNRVTHQFASMEKRNAPRITSPLFQIKGAEEHVSSRPIMTHLQSFNRSPTCSSVLHTFGFTQKESPEAPKRLSPFRSFSSPDHRAITHPFRRSRSMMSTFFFKRKSAK
ncbi:protein ABIL1 isoform X1 [Cinnamomum micranthum f. kanehirae]|uniref:Protein ABIL1 isoform X1 n=1 Tax=Cinnamomum micranthum f. kanehirae TaxID=337451 RepID=A0A443PQY7_9MAGN|nr:protein ABIL1 isoform X1 [Cinnamomum micranthum f. kanehirae]